MPRYILECSSLNLELVRNEILSLSSNFGDFSLDQQIGNFIIISGNWKNASLSQFVNIVDEVLQETGSPELFDSSLLPQGKYFVRLKRFNEKSDEYTESSIGFILKSQGKISFNEYDFMVRAIHADSWYLTIQVYERDKKVLEQRRAPMRPFFSPVSLHPKYGIYLVNVSMTKPGQTVLDPFCGTGGILIEAAKMGRKVVGSDSSLAMVMGARLNLKYFGISDALILNKDILDLKLDSAVDAIVTDMPYGRNSTLNGKPIESLYTGSFEAFHRLLKDEGHCAIIVGDSSQLALSEKWFTVESIVPVPQHKSLTRFFTVLRKR